MATWQGVRCSTLPLNPIYTIADIGLVQWILSKGVSGFHLPSADIVHGGFGTIVDSVLPFPILAAAFTFIFDGPQQDINNDGKIDTALVEIYYTNNFPWDTTGGNFDVETVALHEAGHGLSQGHFGKLFRTDRNGKFHFAPRAVMNAGYTGPQRALVGTDIGGHCSIWGEWPNN